MASWSKIKDDFWFALTARKMDFPVSGFGKGCKNKSSDYFQSFRTVLLPGCLKNKQKARS